MSEQRLELLCFRVGGRAFGVDIQTIREILRPQPVTPVPAAPDRMVGVMNLRGDLVPVIDLNRALLGRDAVGVPGEEEKFVVVNARGQLLALRVDGVEDVVSVPLGDLNPLPGTDDPGRVLVVGAFRRGTDDDPDRVALLVRTGALVGIDDPIDAGDNP